MAQSRKRLFIVMVRSDVCSDDLVQNIGDLVCKVLPFSYHADVPFGAYSRETIGQIRAFNAEVLKQLHLKPTMPEPSKDSAKGCWGREVSPVFRTGNAGLSGCHPQICFGELS